MSNNENNDSGKKVKRALKLLKIPKHFKNKNTENQNIVINLNKIVQNRDLTKIKIGFNNILRKDLKPLATDFSLEKNLENPLQNKIFSNRHFDFLRIKYKNITNNLNESSNKNVFSIEENPPQLSLYNTFKIKPLNYEQMKLKSKKILFNKTNLTRNGNEKINDTNKKIINEYLMSNNSKTKTPFKLSDTFFKNFYNQKEMLINRERHFSIEKDEKNKTNGYKKFLERTKMSDLPIVLSNTKEEKNNSKFDFIQTEKEKYEKLSETFLKMKLLLSLDCEPGKERNYIKNFFKRFGYNDNEITEEKIINFLKFLNTEPFPLDPNLPLKDNILLAMNYQGNDNSDNDIDNNEENNEYEEEEEDYIENKD